MAQLTAALDAEHRKVRVDPRLTDAQLLQLIDDELSSRPLDSSSPLARDTDARRQVLGNSSSSSSRRAASCSDPDYLCDHVGRLQRFLSNIDYLLHSSNILLR